MARPQRTVQTVFGLIRLVGDGAAIYSGLLLAYWIRFHSGWLPVQPRSWVPSNYYYGFAAATVFLLLLYGVMGLYRPDPIRQFIREWMSVARATLVGAVLLLAFTFYVQPAVPYARTLPPLAVLTVVTCVGLERRLIQHAERWSIRRLGQAARVLIVGEGPMAARVAHAVNSEAGVGYDLAGYLSPDGAALPDMPPGLRVLGQIAEIEAVLGEHRLDEVIVAGLMADRSRLVDLILACERALVAFKAVPDLYDIMTSSVEVTSIDGIPLLGVRESPLDRPWNRLLKRAEDLTVGGLSLVLAVPAILAAAWLVRRDSPGPAFYRQERCGRDGRPFRLWKLRTMWQDAEETTGPVWAVEGDPRCTPMGRILRRWNLDELPQLLNVMRGEMSLVGPRPERPFFVERFKSDIGRYMTRHRVKPGMTGWAQVNGLRGNTSIEERIKYDLYYLENWSLLFDLKILVLTLFARKNAY